MSEGVRVRGGATAEEVAVVLALLTTPPAAADRAPDGYARWRATRRQALTHTLEADRPT